MLSTPTPPTPRPSTFPRLSPAQYKKRAKSVFAHSAAPPPPTFPFSWENLIWLAGWVRRKIQGGGRPRRILSQRGVGKNPLIR